MKVLRNIVLEGKYNKPILTDVFYHENINKAPVVIFSHGFKGFKDWGHFNRVAEAFVNAGFVFVKFNFSHNGTTPQQPDEFADLEAFGNNNFQIELDDLGTVLDFVFWKENQFHQNIAADKIYLLGHSRGGGISILKAWKDPRISKLAVWASVNEFGKFWTPDIMEQWKNEGVMYVLNSRTGQELPMYYKAYENFYDNKNDFDIPTSVRTLNIPFLIVHGTADTTVSVNKAHEMHEWNSTSELLIIEKADHVFGAKHPWAEKHLPPNSEKAVEATLEFFLS